MMPTFSIEWNASSRLRSCWNSAYTTPPTAESDADREHEHAEPQRQHTEPVHEHAYEAVDRDLDHHAAHQRRHRSRRDRMRARQPAVQRHHPGLRPHADECRQRDRNLQAGAAGDNVRAIEQACVRSEQHRDPGTRAGEMRRPRCRGRPSVARSRPNGRRGSTPPGATSSAPSLRGTSAGHVRTAPRPASARTRPSGRQ